MTQASMMAQAKAGNPAAIAALLNHRLQARDITAQVRVEGLCLTVDLCAAKPIPQAAVIAFLQQGLTRLQPHGIQSVMVIAQTLDGHGIDWMESFFVDGAGVASRGERLEAMAAGLSAAESGNLESGNLESGNLESEAQTPEDAQSELPAAAIADLERIMAERRTPPTMIGLLRRSLMPPPTLTRTSVRSPDPSVERSAAPSEVQPLSPAAASRHFSRGIEALVLGFGLAFLLFKVIWLKRLFAGAVIMVHEIGHAVTHWLFGRPALPTVNLYFGGGVTLAFGQMWLLNVAIYVGIGWLFRRWRDRPKVLLGLGIGTLIYTICLLTPLNLMLSTLMGHGLELVAIAVGLHLAATGRWCRHPGDRLIFAMLSFFIFFYNVEFCWMLLHDPDHRAVYEDGIGGMMDNDFVILANQYWRTELVGIIRVFLISCFAAIAVGLGSAYWRPWNRGMRR